VILGYKCFQGGFEGTSVGKEVTIGRRTFSVSVAKYRPHRPHRSQSADFQVFHAVGKQCLVPTARDHYRPLSKVPPADRPPGNEPFCRAFSPTMVTAVDTVGILAGFNYGL
jgi:hypothetical protein